MKIESAVNINNTKVEEPAKFRGCGFINMATIKETPLTSNLKNGIVWGSLSIVQLAGLATLHTLNARQPTTEELLLTVGVLAESSYFCTYAILSFREAFNKIAVLEQKLVSGLSSHGVFSSGSKTSITEVTTNASLGNKRSI
jgi:hypothetical protein